MADNQEEQTAQEPEAAAPAEQAEAPAAQGAAPAAPAQPAEVLTPKQRRQRRRALRVAPARPPRTPEERQAERIEERRRKARVRSAWRTKARAKAASRRTGEGEQTPTVAAERPAGQPKLRLGVVVSDRPDKTIVVRIDAARRHRRYEKIVRRSTTLHAHDERNEAHQGDTVRVVESRPISRTKRWRLIEVVERAR
jgi:small subunit ribosomal protein S17